MSGICGIVSLDGASVDCQVLGQLTESMSFRGPDAQEVWLCGRVGFGHTLLRTAPDSTGDLQPRSRDGRVWITADARIDGQAQLRRELEAHGREVTALLEDADLILEAYLAWGDACVEHLIGDFAFAIWDSAQQRLFCARDHFGVKPFFHASTGRSFVFSNTLNCLRGHPEVSDRLNDLAIADFLLYEENRDPVTTAFDDIRRLPPAHSLTWSETGIEIRRYWTLPTDLGIVVRPKADYVERFKELLAVAVADRLRTDRVGIEMSGGLDSTAVAATARALSDGAGQAIGLQAYSYVYETPDDRDERYYADQVAVRLGIPIRHFYENRYSLFERFGGVEARRPEPLHDPSMALMIDAFRGMAPDFRVCLTGWDGEALLDESPKPYFRYLLRKGRLIAALTGAIRYAISQRRLLPHRMTDWFTRRAGRPAAPIWPYPGWLDPELEDRLKLRERWQRYQEPLRTPHPLRPYAYRTYEHISRVSSFFEPYDAGTTGCAVEYRHPLMDLRLVQFCLSLPPFPWCARKRILREAMRGVLPEEVRLRPKTPLPSWNCLAPLEREDASGLVKQLLATAAGCRYVDWRKVPLVDLQADPGVTWMNLRPISLDFWLKGLGSRVPATSSGDSSGRGKDSG